MRPFARSRRAPQQFLLEHLQKLRSRANGVIRIRSGYSGCGVDAGAVCGASLKIGSLFPIGIAVA